MKNVVKKLMGVMFLLALTVTLNSGFLGTLPQFDNGGISVMSDEPSPTEIQY